MRSILTCLALCGLAACAGPNYGAIPLAPTGTTPEMPAAQGLPDYRLQIGDVLDIKFYMNPELDETVTIRPDGMISTKLAQNIAAYNRTVDQVNADLHDAYKSELRDPRMTTVVKSFAPIRVYVSGEVVTPGEFITVGQAPTLTQIIARAGGIRNSGTPDKILIIRRGLSNESHAFLANYDAATQGGDPMRYDVRLAPYDVVHVPKTGNALLYREYQQYIQQYVNPTIGASYSLNN